MLGFLSTISTIKEHIKQNHLQVNFANRDSYVCGGIKYSPTPIFLTSGGMSFIKCNFLLESKEFFFLFSFLPCGMFWLFVKQFNRSLQTRHAFHEIIK
jgi:hypothetical protein